ncbi:hypothetical protein [Plantactinospora sp. WMMB782]|uniref:hypothetical protein n=1 Tax=Plantactinospora sp. WMMB782 TaxID=3404121 RepID=UPI003B935CF3
MSWYSVRCVFEWEAGTYEERITLWEASSFEVALQLAEDEAIEYAEDVDTLRYLGLAQCYLIGDGQPQSGDEVYSLLRDSGLSPNQYITSFFDTGRERQG